MRVLLADGPNLAMRRFYAMGGKQYVDQPEEHGKETIRKFLESVASETVKAIQARVKFARCDDVRVALETPKNYPGWRYAVYNDYKFAQSDPRPPVAQALQKPLTRQCADVGIKCLWAFTMEADDVIATMVSEARDWLLEDPGNHEIGIWTNDRDLWQVPTGLLPNVKILVEGTQGEGEDIEVLDAAAIREKLGVPPDAIPLFKALVGDKSDNLEGVPGVGPKTARDILRFTPRRQPVPYIPDPTKAGPKLASLLLSKEAQWRRDTDLAYLRRNATLRDAARDLLSTQ